LLQSQVYAQVQVLFKDAPELLEEFKAFLPDVMGVHAGPQPGFVGVLPQPPGGAVVNGSQWGPVETASATGSAKAPAKRKKKPAEEVPIPPSAKSSSSRVRDESICGFQYDLLYLRPKNQNISI
jgi:paired amphipathic helix protein Sin3a